MCAGKPGRILNLSYRTELDSVILEWEGVANTGFSGILGYNIYRLDEEWILVYTNSPTDYIYSQSIEYTITYQFKISAENWVGETFSEVISVTLPILPDASKSTIRKPTEAAVLSELSVSSTVRDTLGNIYTHSIPLFLRISDICTQSSSFLCSRIPSTDSLYSPDLLSKPLYLKMIYQVDGTYSISYTPHLKGGYTYSVWLLQNGGLWSEYWDNIWFYGTPLVEVSDSYLYKSWNDTELITENTGDYVSIRWQGMLRAPYSEVYRFYGYGDDAVKIWLDEEVLIDSWDICCKEVIADKELQQGNYYSIRIDYRQITGTAKMSLAWSSFSIPKQIIPSSVLYSPHILKEAQWVVNVQTGKSTVSLCYYDPISTITAGVSVTLSIYSLDAIGQLYDNPTDIYSITIKGPADFSFYSTYLGTGKSSVTFRLTKSGSYTVAISLYNQPIKNNSFTLTVLPGALSSEKSTSDLQAIINRVGYLTVGEQYTISLTSRDAYSNLISASSLESYISFSFVDNNDYLSPINLPYPDNWTSKYGINYIGNLIGSIFKISAYRAGKYSADVYVENARLKESPIVVKVVPLGLYMKNSEAVFKKEFVAGETIDVKIQCRDVYFNNILLSLSGINSYEVKIDGPETVKAVLRDLAPGAFETEFNVKIAGNYKMVVKLNGVDVIGSGGSVVVKTGPSDSKKAIIKNFVPNILAGDKVEIRVSTRDQLENPTAYSEDLIDVTIKPTLTTTVLTPIITNHNDGTFTIEFTPTVHDDYILNLYLNSEEIAGSPLNLSVTPNKIRAEYSIFTLIEPIYNITEGLLTIESKDIYQNLIPDPINNSLMAKQFYLSNILHIESSNTTQILATTDVNYAQYLIDLSSLDSPGNYSITLGLVQQDGLVAYYYRTQQFDELQSVIGYNNHPKVLPEYYTGIDTIDLNWGLDASEYFEPPLADFYSVKWEGWIHNRYKETVRFYLKVGDDELVRMMVNGVVVGDSLSSGEYLEVVEGSVDLDEDMMYEIEIKYVENGGIAMIRLDWESDTFVREVVAKEFLYGLVNSDSSPYSFEMVNPNSPPIDTGGGTGV